MDLELEGKACVVLGGSRGIGRAVAEGLAAEGADVAVCARTPGPLEEAAGALRERGVAVHAEPCDVGDPDALGDFLDGAREALGRVDVLVHNASALALGPDLEAWDASLSVDLMGAVHACERVLPWMAEAGGGSVVFVSSISGLEVDPSPGYAYTAAKAALMAYAKKLAVLRAPEGIRVNAVAPGSIDFEGGVWDRVRKGQPELYEQVRESIPWKRMGTPGEVADVVVWLSSPRARWVTGETVSVDGGQHRGMR